jgi:molybdopterin-guanine dinucleotide biosynthesis protein
MAIKTPIALITGSLGSGKTTLLRHILQAPSDRIAIFWCLKRNYVAGRADYEDFAADSTQLVFIGLDLRRERDQILSRLRACEV